MTTAATTDIWYTSAKDLLAAYRSRSLSPLEVTRAILRRIEQLNPRLHAFLHVNAEGALKAAQAAEAAYAAENAAPLAGVPISVKDLIQVRGLPMTFGSLAYHNFVSEQDSVSVGRVRAAGGVLLGKTNTSEFGSTPMNDNPLGESSRTPWNLSRSSGGSSGGAGASVAAGLGPIGTGTDFGGSVRIPAAMCGVFGIKPTLGRIARDLRYNLTGDFFSHEGVLTRTVGDAALYLDVTAGPHPNDRFSQIGMPPPFAAGLETPPRHLRVAWTPDLGYIAADRECVTICEQAVRHFESVVGAIDVQAPSGVAEGVAGWRVAGRAAQYDATGFARRKEHWDVLTEIMRDEMTALERTTLPEFFEAALKVRSWREQAATFFERYDLLLTPTLPVASMPVNATELVVNGVSQSGTSGLMAFTAPFNATGQPAATVPCGFTAAGLPVGLQMVGRFGEDLLVLQAARAFEQVLPWADKVPAV